MLEAGRVEVGIAGRLILIGVLANLAFKATAALALGHPALRRWVAGTFGSALVLWVGLLLVWPSAAWAGGHSAAEAPRLALTSDATASRCVFGPGIPRAHPEPAGTRLAVPRLRRPGA